MKIRWLTYMMEYVAQAFWKKPNVGCFTPYQKIQGNKKEFLFLANTIKTEFH